MLLTLLKERGLGFSSLSKVQESKNEWITKCQVGTKNERGVIYLRQVCVLFQHKCFDFSISYDYEYDCRINKSSWFERDILFIFRKKCVCKIFTKENGPNINICTSTFLSLSSNSKITCKVCEHACLKVSKVFHANADLGKWNK